MNQSQHNRHATWSIVASEHKNLIIKDEGPWDTKLTITNDVEYVVDQLISGGYLGPGMRLFYFDSEDHLDEILIENGEFKDFRRVNLGSVSKKGGQDGE